MRTQHEACCSRLRHTLDGSPFRPDPILRIRGATHCARFEGQALLAIPATLAWRPCHAANRLVPDRSRHAGHSWGIWGLGGVGFVVAQPLEETFDIAVQLVQRGLGHCVSGGAVPSSDSSETDSKAFSCTCQPSIESIVDALIDAAVDELPPLDMLLAMSATYSARKGIGHCPMDLCTRRM